MYVFEEHEQEYVLFFLDEEGVVVAVCVWVHTKW